jgi:hypothetical protein
MQQPWPAPSKKGFWDLFPWKKSLKISVLEAESSRGRHDSRNFAEKAIFQKILAYLLLSLWIPHYRSAGPCLMVFANRQPESWIDAEKNLRRCNLHNRQLSGKPFAAPSELANAWYGLMISGPQRHSSMGAMILKRSSISRSRRKPTSEVIVAPWKSIMMVGLKSGRIASFWLSPLSRTLKTPELLFYPPYIK